MQLGLYTVHSHRKADHLETVGEASWLSFFPPLWALHEGLWITLAGLLALYAAAIALVPLGFGAVYLASAVIVGLDGASVQRLELWLRGWREVATVSAASHEAAEELYVTGHSAPSGAGT